MTLRVGIVGCGLIGRRRAAVASGCGQRVVAVADLDGAKAAEAAREFAAEALTDWRRLVERRDIDAVVVATFNAALAPITIASLESGKHVLCEKPLGRNLAESEQMVAAARKAGRTLKTGFNHRHHPALWKARRLCLDGAIGPIMFIRAVYGHGGRPGYDKEWRADGALAGGGELLDQGVHILDLCRWFMGDFTEAFALTSTFFWDLGCFPTSSGAGILPESAEAGAALLPAAGRSPQRRLEDNAFALLRTREGRVVQFHTSWTQWKNRFSFEVCGQAGSLDIHGLGGSYGTETLTITHRSKEGGAPKQEAEQFTGPDDSWRLEWQEFVSALTEGRQPLANGQDGLEAMRLIAGLYDSARSGQVVKLPLPA
ncbi:MAG TPA: Gfo/Idh/MocA family oxidoreductase [Dongiaceae bacterium]|nr:Gfo/Idh/MocA family oxidoreductase [Dongiaceae bacterium]